MECVESVTGDSLMPLGSPSISNRIRHCTRRDVRRKENKKIRRKRRLGGRI